MRHASIVVLVIMLAAQVPAFAETVSAPVISVTANVKNTFTLVVDLRRDVTGFPDIADDTKMAFGDLIPNPGNGGTTLIAAEGVVAFCTANSHQQPYTMDSTISLASKLWSSSSAVGRLMTLPVTSVESIVSQPGV